MDRDTRYEQVSKDILAVLEGETNPTARMATVACLLAQAFPERFSWTGFYCVDPNRTDELVVGPYQGTLGCLRIAFGRGVCGQVAAARKSLIVDDVHAHPGHITCDSQTNSEIVVPVFDGTGALIAVLDVDATLPAAFDERDRTRLEALMQAVFAV